MEQKMVRPWIVVLLVGIMFLPSVALAKLKIGVVNIQRAVSETQEGKDAEQRLKRLKGKLENTLNRKLKEFYERERKLQEAASVLKESDRRKRAAESRQKMEALQKEYLGAERELMQQKASVLRKITAKLNKIIGKIAKKEGFDYIFANAAVLWAPRHVDLTNEVIRQYNKRHK
jgi:outer membrane protein